MSQQPNNSKPAARKPFSSKPRSGNKTGNAVATKSTNVHAPLNLRAQVIMLLAKVLEGQSLNQILPQALQRVNPKDKALFNELVMGTLRQWFALDAQIQPMLDKKLSSPKVHIALLLGLYQILQTRIPAHAAINETVDAIRQLKMDKASGLVNALLRRSLRELESIQTSFEQQHGLPDWLYRKLKQDWAEHAQQIAYNLRQAAPLTLRVNTLHRSRDGYLQAIQQQGLAAKATEISAQGIQLQQAVQIPELLGYSEGWFSVQDEHAQLCCQLMGDLTDKLVLDACAAPGGKTAHILEKNKPAQLIALDNDAQRLQRVTENLQRLQLNSPTVSVVTADACTWVAPQPLDAILLDAPCTATGVIRRHPDIRLLRRAEDVQQTVQLQAQLLDHLWGQLKSGGILLYVTCSILKSENENQMTSFLARTPDAKELPIVEKWGLPQQVGRQLFPAAEQGDGFYFCRLIKQ